MILYCTSDLMMSSSVNSVARENDLTIRYCRKLSDLENELAGGEVRLLLIDLQMPQMDIESVAPILENCSDPRPLVIAYAQHVHESLLEQAKQAAIDQVMTRGQFNASIEKTLLASQ